MVSEPTRVSSSVRLEYRGDVALLVVDNPPVNALSHHVRSGLAEGLALAEASDAVAIVLICAGRTFIAGADISEFGAKGPQGASLTDVQDAMENCAKPVVAAIHGTALGGGLEVALCAHYRVAVSAAQLGLPEVNLGLLPGAGGTQRLPRVVGVDKALQMITGGLPIGATEALAIGLIDDLVDGDVAELEAVAVAFARTVVAQARPLVRIRDRDDRLAGVDAGVFAAARAAAASKQRGFAAPPAIIDCIEATTTGTFEEGLAYEGRRFVELMKGPQSGAQRYAFFAERAANKIPGIGPDTPVTEIRSVGVLGAGTMGGGIAMNFANVGIPVVIVERDQASLDRGLGVVRKNYERSAARGSIDPADVETRMALLTGSTDKQDLGPCDLVIEAVFEDLALKQSVFAEFDAICKPGAILASNTSMLDINVIAAQTSRPESVIGLHFFSPANVMKLLEIVRGDATAPAVIASSMAVAKRIGKVAAVVGVCHGFVGNRMLARRGAEAERMVLEGATPAQVDRVLVAFGFPMGPFSMSDLAGLDIGWNEQKSARRNLREVLCESGRRGQKNGRGYYTYDPATRAATPDPDVEQLIREYAAGLGLEQREISDQEVLERLLYPMINEGARILEEGIAIRGSDIDVVWVKGYGFPVYRGGPMYWADSVGLGEIVARIGEYSTRLGGEHWELSPLLARLAAEGGSLSRHGG